MSTLAILNAHGNELNIIMTQLRDHVPWLWRCILRILCLR